VAVGFIRDPNAVTEIDTLVTKAEEAIMKKAAHLGFDDEDYQAAVHVPGRDGAMGEREPESSVGHEVGLFIDVVAPTAEAADDLLEEATYHAFVSDFPGRQTTAGNVAFPMSPSHVATEEAFEFSIWHAVDVDDPLEPFDVSVEHLTGDEA